MPALGGGVPIKLALNRMSEEVDEHAFAATDLKRVQVRGAAIRALRLIGYPFHSADHYL